MILRTMFTAFALTCMCLVGCNTEEKNADTDTNEVQNNSTNTKAADNQDDDQDNAPSLPPSNVKYEPYRAENWRPDTGKPNPDAWQPEDSEATKATGSIFKALKNAVKNDTSETKQ